MFAQKPLETMENKFNTDLRIQNYNSNNINNINNINTTTNNNK